MSDKPCSNIDNWGCLYWECVWDHLDVECSPACEGFDEEED